VAEIKEQIFKQNGYQLHMIPTKKFKTNILVIRFLAPLAKDTATKRALLPFILQKGTKTLPSERLLRTKLDELFGAQLNIDCSKKGENHLITLRVNFINDKFLPSGYSIMEDILELVRQIVLEPNVVAGAFPKELVEKEKQTLLQKIESVKDQKMSYANMRLMDEMCKNEPYSTHVHGYKEDLAELNEQIVYQAYTDMLKADWMDIYLLGDIDVEDSKEKVIEKLSFDRDVQYKPTVVEHTKQIDQYNEVVEPEKVQQGKLHIGFRTNTTFKDDEYFTLQVFNGLFGGFPHSKLFMNVREKHQLAYYATSRMESHKGLLLVFSGIAPEQFEKAKEIILEQVEEMKKGNFTEEQIEETKRLTIHQLKETLDNPFGIVELLYHQVLAEKEITPTEMFKRIQNVTKEELITFSEKLELDTIYFLTSEGDQS
jgi:predicted Zn-dependent peptidase